MPTPSEETPPTLDELAAAVDLYDQLLAEADAEGEQVIAQAKYWDQLARDQVGYHRVLQGKLNGAKAALAQAEKIEHPPPSEQPSPSQPAE